MSKRRPNKLIHFSCVDKQNFESWDDDRALLNFIRPYRCILSGSPNVGKTAVIKTLLCTADPFFTRGFIWHPDIDVVETGEYADTDLEPIQKLPPTEFWYEINRDKDHMVLVIDDIDLGGLDRVQRHLLDRLVSNVSTHCCLTIIMASQIFFNLPPFLRKTANLFVLYKPVSEDQDNKAISKRVGLSPETLSTLFKEHCPSSFDSVWIDLTPKSPAKIRINGIKALKETKKEKWN